MTTEGLKTVADVLHEAREFMERRGWTRQILHDRNTGKVCAMGAVIYSQKWDDENWRTGNGKLLNETERRLRETIVAHTGTAYDQHDDPWSVEQWNDHAAKDIQEVLDLFAKAEKIERAGYDPDA